MSYKHSIEIKVLSVSSKRGVPNKSNEVSASVIDAIAKGVRGNLLMGPKASLKTVQRQLESVGHSVRVGVSGGCYGARDGKSYDGLTVYADATQFPERSLDSDGDEIVNIYSLIDNMGGELVEDLDGDIFRDACEGLGLEVSRNNTYNYAGQDSETPYFLVDADYSIIEGEKSSFLAIKFHCGGDIRGNYTETVVFKFSGLDDIYSVVYPQCELKNDGGES